MKKTFHGYYSPTSEEYELLWKEALIVIDTNVLLNLYRLPTMAREDLFKVLGLLKQRLWIPHQVALEFQRQRLSVISEEKKATEKVLSVATSLVTDVKNKVEALQLDKRQLDIDPKSLFAELEKSNAAIIKAIESAHKSQLDISSKDPIREKVDLLFNTRVGKGPESQASLDALIEDGESRFTDLVPPGYMDIDKSKDPKQATFTFDRLKYQRKFGDLILWRQLIEHVKKNGIKRILFITDDSKEDWWWKEQNRTIGPHPELIREIGKSGGAQMFWMYSSVQFVEHANKYVKAEISEKSVDEMKIVALRGPDTSSDNSNSDRQTFPYPHIIRREASNSSNPKLTSWKGYKIERSVQAACEAVKADPAIGFQVRAEIEFRMRKERPLFIHIDQLQDLVEETLMDINQSRVALAYGIYRARKAALREVELCNKSTENSNSAQISPTS
jgi:hypothetical protein